MNGSTGEAATASAAEQRLAAEAVVDAAAGAAGEEAGDRRALAERMEQLEAAARNQQRKIAHTQAFIDRFRYKASKARQVQSRVKALEKLDRVAGPQRRTRSVKFRFPEPPRSGRTVITLTDIDAVRATIAAARAA